MSLFKLPANGPHLSFHTIFRPLTFGFAISGKGNLPFKQYAMITIMFLYDGCHGLARLAYP